jgi:hypothetical protein
MEAARAQKSGESVWNYTDLKSRAHIQCIAICTVITVLRYTGEQDFRRGVKRTVVKETCCRVSIHSCLFVSYPCVEGVSFTLLGLSTRRAKLPITDGTWMK